MNGLFSWTPALTGVVCLLTSSVARAAGDGDLARMQDELNRTKTELAATRAELGSTRDALSRLADKVASLEAARGSGAAAAPGAAAGPRLAPVNADNPAISFVVDTELATGNENPGWDFSLQNGELFVSAPVDPFLRGYASINGTSDAGFDIEEAALVTTSLPWNLTVKGGRFFSNVGRMPHWHDEALPFVRRPESIDRFFGGETISEGAEVTWLAPTDHFIQVTAGLYDAIGGQNFDQLQENGFEGQRSFNELTWLVHPSTYFDLTDTLNLEVGGTYFGVPQDGTRNLFGVDVTLRHQPGTSGFYQGLVLGSEWYWNDERFQDVAQGFDPATGEAILGAERYRRNGGYAYVEGFFGRRYSAGLLGDLAEDVAGPTARQRTLSVFATWMPSEFQRLRLQADEIHESGDDNYRLTLQWTAFLGSHSHGFAAR